MHLRVPASRSLFLHLLLFHRQSNNERKVLRLAGMDEEQGMVNKLTLKHLLSLLGMLLLLLQGVTLVLDHLQGGWTTWGQGDRCLLQNSDRLPILRHLDPA